MVWNKGLHGYRMGAKNNFWKGGITSEDQKMRSRLRFRLWRLEVYKLNPKKCFVCSNPKFLVAHHIKSFKSYPSLRYNPKNGIVVCRHCHPMIHKYGLKYTLKNYKPIIRKCITCNKAILVQFHRKETNLYCSKTCWYNRPTRKTHAERVEYKRNWYKKNKAKL